jgi:anti-sigma B factor antagonist
MEIQEQRQGAVTILKPMGALIDPESRLFKEQALETMNKSMGRVLVDSSAVPFLDSTGVEALVDLTEQLAQSGRALKLCSANDTLKKVLELTGWSHAFEYFDDVNAGVRSFL